MAVLPIFLSMVVGWSLLSGSQNHLTFNNNYLSSVLQLDLAGGSPQVPL